MSLHTCSLSGEVIQHPVISKKTGHLYEKEIILKHLESTGQCPITGQEMSQDDLVEVAQNQTVVRQAKGNVSDILRTMQSEWDILLLENYQIRKNLQEMKEELAHNLYQHEAASLVISRLIKEKEEAVNKLNEFKTKLQMTNQEEEEQFNEEEEFDFMGIYNDLIDRINELSSHLISNRKKREISKNLKTQEIIKSYNVKGSFPIHSSSKPGITCIDIHPQMGNLIVTGGNDSQVVIFDKEKQSTLFSTLDRGHTKRVNDVKFYPSADIQGFMSGSADFTASLWLQDEGSKVNFSERYRTNVHKAAVSSLSFHPLREYCLVASRDKHWSFHSLFKGVCLTKIKTETEQEISKCHFHPDGLIFATGEGNGLVRIWDISTQTSIASFETFKTEISGLCFSENGYYLATSAIKDNTVSIFDLRKSEVVRKIQLPEKHHEVRAVKFDHSGSYLGIAGSSVHMYNVKTNQIFAEWNEHTDLVTDIGFGRDCDYFATTSLDRNLKIFSE